jgi:hypothetical protein
MGTAARASVQNYAVAWRAQTGPQTALIACPVFEVFFGGSRGGGKTDGMLGDWIRHADLYGEHAIGLMVRRERTQLVETIERSRAIYGLLGAKYNEQDKMWRFPNGARLRFAYLERDADADAYQGHSYCVAVDTRIRMADGALKLIGDIRPGEFVATLEGSRRVSAVTRPYVAPCVRAVVRDSAGLVIGHQYHPVWHPVLTTAGLISSRRLRKSRNGVPPLFAQCAADRLNPEFRRDGHQETQGWVAWSKDAQSGCKGSQLTRIEGRPPEWLCVPVVLHEPSLRSATEKSRVGHRAPTLSRGFCKSYVSSLQVSRGYQVLLWGRKQLRALAQLVQDHCGLSGPNERAYALNGLRAKLGYQSCYSFDHGRDDVPVPAWSKTGLTDTPSPDDAGNRFHAWLSDVWGTIRRYSHLESERWAHPYTGEARRLSEGVTWGTMECSFYGETLVADLSVEGANHYITELGLVNKNTRMYIEELGTFPSATPVLKLMATLRSGAGVPCGFRATGNPGGPGHQWVKARYIDAAPTGWKIHKEIYRNPWTGETIERDRVYIPSRLTDNRYLGSEYVANLQMTGSQQLVKAWLEGDWSVIEGAFFPEWSSERHVIAPFAIPDDWIRFRSADWGSARPFSVGWWAVVGDWPAGLGDARDETSLHASGTLRNRSVERANLLPRGALIRYREWYGASAPNVGLKLPAEDVAEGIKLREIHEPRNAEGKPLIAYGVMDPSAFASDGGPSIAERMATRGVLFRRADNARVAQRGAMGGWDQLRARLIGDGERPMIYVVSTCKDTIRTLPALQHDSARAEDVDSDGEDHAADEVRYACMSRPYSRRAALKPSLPTELIYEVKDGRITANMSIRDIVAMKQRKREREA